jgi:hypothetical protein
MNATHKLKDGRTLSAEICDECGDLNARLLVRLASAASAVREGSAVVVELDWATLRLRAASGQVRVEEPDYRRNPENFTDTLVRTSRVFAAQEKLMQVLGVVAEPVSAGQYVRVSNDALTATSIVGTRERETDRIASGWQLIAASESGNEQFGLYKVSQLAGQHPSWCAAFALPPQWAFRFVGNTLIDCLTPAGETRSVMLSVDV